MRNNYHFYQLACCFVQQYRNCLIDTLGKKFGPTKKAVRRVQGGEGSDVSQISNNEEFKTNPRAEPVVTATKSPECIPLICNDFLTNYLPLKCNLFNQKTAIGFTQHLCMWLYNRKLTKAKLELLI